MKYYWILDALSDDSVINQELIEIGCVHHVHTNSFGYISIKRYVKSFTDEELIFYKLKLGDRYAIWPVTEDEMKYLVSRGFIKS